MEFALSDEQRLIRDSVERLLAERYAFAQRRRYAAEPDGFGRDLWRRYAELGLLALPFPEKRGGLGGGAVETMIVMEALGRALALEPYLATVILAGGVLRRAGSEAQQRALVAPLIAGDLVLALAHHEPGARYDLAHVQTAARQAGSGWLLDGRKSLVLHGGSANRLMVSARVHGAASSHEGIALFVVDPEASGVSRRSYPTQDGLRAAEITLDGVRVGEADVIGEAGDAFPVLVRVVEEAIAALCAEAVGAMDALHALTLDYLKQRRQFGVPIGSFQALQHRAVDMLIALEQARSMALFAAMMLDEEDAVERASGISAAKVQIGRSARLIGEAAIQLHGGIGMTAEYAAGHYFKRLTAIDLMFGDADHHQRRLARMGGLFRSD
jgi:pimeloyl-CoA dehydrogenase small subunit